MPGSRPVHSWATFPGTSGAQPPQPPLQLQALLSLDEVGLSGACVKTAILKALSEFSSFLFFPWGHLLLLPTWPALQWGGAVSAFSQRLFIRRSGPECWDLGTWVLTLQDPSRGGGLPRLQRSSASMGEGGLRALPASLLSVLCSWPRNPHFRLCLHHPD